MRKPEEELHDLLEQVSRAAIAAQIEVGAARLPATSSGGCARSSIFASSYRR
jgi:hypothetical protein